mmetsp:Transcript_13985/g.33560  ORF Transcript_13985/g.33560 Transcript_13985/m.33560 type:complete len:177 (-) Transcript_13985:83-613(-)
MNMVQDSFLTHHNHSHSHNHHNRHKKNHRHHHRRHPYDVSKPRNALSYYQSDRGHVLFDRPTDTEGKGLMWQDCQGRRAGFNSTRSRCFKTRRSRDEHNGVLNRLYIYIIIISSMTWYQVYWINQLSCRENIYNPHQDSALTDPPTQRYRGRGSGRSREERQTEKTSHEIKQNVFY